MRTYRTFFKKNYTVKVVVAAFVAIMLLWSICGIKANAAEKADNDRAEYQMQENDFVKEIKKCMEERGYYNSGINLTKVMDTDGSREYKVMVHHGDIDLEDDAEVTNLYEMQENVNFNAENATVNFTIF